MKSKGRAKIYLTVAEKKYSGGKRLERLRIVYPSGTVSCMVYYYATLDSRIPNDELKFGMVNDESTFSYTSAACTTRDTQKAAIAAIKAYDTRNFENVVFTFIGYL